MQGLGRDQGVCLGGSSSTQLLGLVTSRGCQPGNSIRSGQRAPGPGLKVATAPPCT